MTHTARRQLEDIYRYQADAVRNSLARKVGRETAEDLVGVAFVKLAEALAREPVKDAPALFGTVVANLLKNHYRDEESHEEAGLVPLPDATTEDDYFHPRPVSFEELDFTDAFDGALRTLPEPARDAFILTELRGLDQRDAGEVLDVDQSTISRRVERARQALVHQIGYSRV